MPGITDTIIAANQINQGRERTRLQELALDNQQARFDTQQTAVQSRFDTRQSNDLNAQSQEAFFKVIESTKNADEAINVLGSMNAIRKQQGLPLLHDETVVDLVSKLPASMFGDKKQIEKFGTAIKQGVGPDGKPMFFQAGDQGTVRQLSGATPPSSAKSSPEEKRLQAARIRKAEADAELAELKQGDAIKKAKAGKSSATELVELAQSLLTDDGEGLAEGVGSVFGSFQGVQLSLRPATVDAEARVDRLVALFTVENLDKMSGVLSDTDIKILRQAGSLLENKRISDKAALEAIQIIVGDLEFRPKGSRLKFDAQGNQIQ